MAFQHIFSSFNVRSGTGSQTVSGLGFTPKVIWFFSCATSGFADDFAIMFTGFDDGVTAYGQGFDVVDGDTPPQRVGSASVNGSSLVRVNASGVSNVVMLAAHISSMTSDGFVLSVTTNTSSQNEYVHYAAFGGDDFEYELLNFAATAADPQVISGLSIEPKALIAFEAGTFGDVGVGGGLNLTFVGSSGLASLATYDASRTPLSECQRYLRNGRAFTAVTQGNSQVVVREADAVTFTADGFNIHWSTPSAGPSAIAVLALGGSMSGSAAGVLAAATSAGDQVTAIDPINPVAVLFGSVGHVANTGVSLDMNQMIGAADDATVGISAWSGCLNAVGTSVAAKGAKATAAIYDATAANPGSASPVLAEAALTALGFDSFTMTYETVASPTAIDVMYLALGTADTGRIVVVKVTEPPSDPQVFNFTTTGLTPSSFSLIDGGTQNFGNLLPGSGYGISEDVVENWGVEYSVSNGSPFDNITVAAEEIVTVTVTNTFQGDCIETEYSIRRVRRAPHLNRELKLNYHQRFGLDLEPGFGVTGEPTTAPIIYVKWTDSNGQLWSSYYPMSAGVQGDYTKRLFRNRLGKARDRVYEISTTDAAPWNVLAASLDITPGTK